MSRQHSLFLALAVVCGGALFLSNSARSQLGVAKNYVNLQASTPGTAQSGHSNVSGTSIASQFVGGGAGLTGVDADLLDGLNSSAFLTSVPNPLVLNGTATGGVIQAANSSTVLNAYAVLGRMSSTTAGGLSAGVRGVNESTSNLGIGVWGSHNGTGWGVYGTSISGTGVLGEAGFIGVMGQLTSSSGYGVLGVATSGTGQTMGVAGETFSSGGFGVYGNASATTGNTVGVRGESSSTTGRGVFGWATAGSGETYGVAGSAFSSAGFGVLAGGIGNGSALKAVGRSLFQGNVRIDTNSRLGIETDPVFPLDFPETLGNKISLWGVESSKSLRVRNSRWPTTNFF